MVGRGLGYPAPREPHDDNTPLEAHAFPREVEHVAPHRIEDNVRPALFCRVFDGIDEVFLFVVHRDFGPEPPTNFDLLCTPSCRDYARSGRHRELYGRRAHAPGARVHQDSLAFAEVRPSVETEEGGLIGEVHCCSDLKRYRVREGEDSPRSWYCNLLGEATFGKGGCGKRPGSHRQVDTPADLHDGTRNLGPGSKGKRRPLLVLAPAQEDVEEVQGRRLNLDDDLA